MMEYQCIISGCSKKFTDSRGVDAHFAFADNPPHPLSKLQLMKEKVRDSGSRKDSKKNYPSNWESTRRRILRRDEYRCQNQDCDAQGGPYGTVELHVHHETPLSEGGSHRTSNLTTLCQSCHSDHHGWPIAGRDGGHSWWHQSGDDLLVRCGRCNQGSILRRNPSDNQIICPDCGKYEITENQTNPDSKR